MNEECPYCGETVEINHDDGYGYGDDTYEQECGSCDKVFTYTTYISYSYTLDKADCLNGLAEHDWKPTRTYPVEFTRMQCKVCDKERELAEDEMKILLIRSKV